MSDFLEALEAQMRAAAHARVAGGHPGGSPWARWLDRLRSGAGALSIVAAVAVVAAVVVVALTTIGHGPAGGRPPSAAPPVGGQQRQELGYIRAANQQVFRMPGCHRHPLVSLPVRNGSPSATLLSVVGVLRRPATKADRLPRALQANDGDAQGIYVKYIRLARVRDGVSYYIVPAASVFPRLTQLSAGCSAAMVAALHAELPRIPARLRSPTLRLQAQIIAEARKSAQQAAGDGICLMFDGASASGGTCGATAREIKQGGLISSFGVLTGVVPDGVATVTIQEPVSNGRATAAVTTNVAGNVFAVSISGSHRGNPRSWAMIWRSPEGTIVKTVPAVRSHGPGSGFCSSRTRSGCGG
jgi:hypothetical protein